LPPLKAAVPIQDVAKPPIPPVAEFAEALEPPTAKTKFVPPFANIELPPEELPGVAPFPTVIVYVVPGVTEIMDDAKAPPPPPPPSELLMVLVEPAPPPPHARTVTEVTPFGHTQVNDPAEL
jgi:hypothetical protein